MRKNSFVGDTKSSWFGITLEVAASALLDRYGSAVNYIEKMVLIAAKVFNVLKEKI
jgi:hypothetical protein